MIFFPKKNKKSLYYFNTMNNPQYTILLYPQYTILYLIIFKISHEFNKCHENIHMST